MFYMGMMLERNIHNGQHSPISTQMTEITVSDQDIKMVTNENNTPVSIIMPGEVYEAIRFILLSVMNRESEGIVKRYLDTAVKQYKKTQNLPLA